MKWNCDSTASVGGVSRTCRSLRKVELTCRRPKSTGPGGVHHERGGAGLECGRRLAADLAGHGRRGRRPARTSAPAAGVSEPSGIGLAALLEAHVERRHGAAGGVDVELQRGLLAHTVVGAPSVMAGPAARPARNHTRPTAINNASTNASNVRIPAMILRTPERRRSTVDRAAAEGDSVAGHVKGQAMQDAELCASLRALHLSAITAGRPLDA